MGHPAGACAGEDAGVVYDLSQGVGRLEEAGTTTGEEAKEEGEKDGSDDGDEDGIEEAAGTGVAEVDHEEAADERADNTDDDVHNGTEALASHEFAGDVAGDEAD